MFIVSAISSRVAPAKREPRDALQRHRGSVAIGRGDSRGRLPDAPKEEAQNVAKKLQKVSQDLMSPRPDFLSRVEQRDALGNSKEQQKRDGGTDRGP
ncbi:hypothetical protein [Cryptosporangium sp. NPDC051539]|uniref:hypothetical protein n=1 Tax=Cryptosporangium sp. NPDC051539 TaxID=3363962 RepID=UPI0037BDA402